MAGLPFILKRAVEYAARLSWKAAAFGAGFHFASSWAGLSLAGEDVAKTASDMVYFYATTGTTVGYGDLSPQGPAGRLFTIFWVMPGAITSFAWLLGRGITAVTSAARKAATGMACYNHRSGHNIFIGYIPGRTETLIAETDAGSERPILVTTDDIEGRVPNGVDWVRAESLSNEQVLERAGAANATRAIVMVGNDEVATSVCLSLTGNFPGADITALFNDRHRANLISRTCPNVRTVVSPSASLLARAACAKGAETVIDLLVSKQKDAAVRTAIFAGHPGGAMDFAVLRSQIMLMSGVTPIAVTRAETGQIDLNPSRDVKIWGGDTIHFIGDDDIAFFDHDGHRANSAGTYGSE